MMIAVLKFVKYMKPELLTMIVFQEHKSGYRLVYLISLGILAVFGSRTFHFSGAGPLGVLTVAFVAAVRWRQEISDSFEVRCCVDTLFSVVDLSFGSDGAASL